jgi:glyoxylase-like metal-dependent hydrolase (beta-lactamase superfamily II)
MSSSAFRGLVEPQLTALRDDIVLLEHSDPGARRARLSTNGYAILRPGRALLIDTNNSALVGFIQDLATRGHIPAALVLSHRHVAGTGDAVDALVNQFKLPVLMHPIDAKHPQSMTSRVGYENPIGHPILSEFGVEAILFPGHTSGHIVLYSAEKGGMLLTGDAAMGTTADQAGSGIQRLIRPPAGLSTDDAELRRQWLSFNRTVGTVLPYHGTGYVDKAADIQSIMAPLTREEPTMGFS